MALLKASARAVRRLKRTRRGESGPGGQAPTINSTAGPTYSRSDGTSSDNSTSGPPGWRTSRRSGVVTRLEGGQRFLGGLGDGEERVELGELEQRLEVLVQPRQPQLAALLADLLGERHQDTQSRGVDVAGAGEVDDEPPGAALDGVEHLLLQLLAVAHDQLAVHADYHDPALVLVQSEGHPRSST